MNDRCDRCGAAAKIRAYRDGLELFFCGHHTKKNIDELTIKQWNTEEVEK